ncbi:uncharacterized protein LOC144557589 [Carex rostrata]
MAFYSKFILAFLVAVVTIDGSIAARHLLDTTPAPEAASTAPKPTVPSSIPVIPTAIPTALPPMPTIPTTSLTPIPAITTTIPSFPTTTIPSIPTTIPTTLPPIPSTIPSIPGFQIPSIPYLSQPPATPSP